MYVSSQIKIMKNLYKHYLLQGLFTMDLVNIVLECLPGIFCEEHHQIVPRGIKCYSCMKYNEEFKYYPFGSFSIADIGNNLCKINFDCSIDYLFGKYVAYNIKRDRRMHKLYVQNSTGVKKSKILNFENYYFQYYLLEHNLGNVTLKQVHTI